MKAVIWGAGGTAEDFLRRKMLYEGYEIIAFTDNNPDVWGKIFWEDKKIIAPSLLKELEFDVIIVCSLHMEAIYDQLVEKLHISSDRILSYRDLEKAAAARVADQYKNRKEKEIQDVLAVYRKGILNVLGSYLPEDIRYCEVYRDEEAYPYIMFEGKRMYYPPDYKFQIKDGKEVILDVLYEQGEDSPHLYVRDDGEIPDDGVIVDAGVCEGNFALRYVERARKIYLIESDPKWMDALRRTFSDYSDKVVYCSKYLSRFETKEMTTLDALVEEEIDFLKMDIEGAEIDALLGGRDILRRSNAKCAICSYHRQFDEKYIRFLLQSYGYMTEHSKGYMFFPYDDNMGSTLDLRRGVVYGRKEAAVGDRSGL